MIEQQFKLSWKQAQNKIIVILLIFIASLCLPQLGMAQQVPDTNYTYFIEKPAYPASKGPVICIDDAHNNFHKADYGFAPFRKLLTQDGYQVRKISSGFNKPDVLKDCNILVIANAINIINDTQWFMPVYPAFTNQEIIILKNWVNQGGALFLIADHMPFAGAANTLAEAFGFSFLNGFAFTRRGVWPPSVFKKSDSTLCSFFLTDNSSNYATIDSVITFTGSAFTIPQNAIPVLKFTASNYILLPDTAWQFTETTPQKSLKGYYQGAICNYGKGRIAVFGEAAMFTAQIANQRIKAGFNSETAPQNAQFLLNLIHWLDKGLLK